MREEGDVHLKKEKKKMMAMAMQEDSLLYCSCLHINRPQWKTHVKQDQNKPMVMQKHSLFYCFMLTYINRLRWKTHVHKTKLE
jgi:hypothetical protein